MSLLFGDDTSPEAEAILMEGYRRMSPTQKLRRVLDLNRTVQILALARIREQYPNADAREVTHISLIPPPNPSDFFSSEFLRLENPFFDGV